jgi:hypothetical protein
VISAGTKAIRPTVVEKNPFIGGIRLGSAWNGLPRDGSMGTMIANRPCGELAKVLFVATVYCGFETAQSPLRGVSEPEFLGCRCK